MSKKAEILEIAAELFYEKGYQSATMNDLANKTGLSKSAIYHYFKSKEELLVEIYERTITDSLKEISRIFDSDQSTIDKLRKIIENHVFLMVDRQPMMKTFFQEEGQLPDKFYRSIQKRKREFNKLIERIYIEGVNEGVFTEANFVLFVNGFLGMCIWVYKWYKRDNKIDPKDISAHFIKLLEEGYLTSTTKQPSIETGLTSLKPSEFSESNNTFKSLIKRLRYHTSMIEFLNKELDILIQNKEAERK